MRIKFMEKRKGSIIKNYFLIILLLIGGCWMKNSFASDDQEKVNSVTRDEHIVRIKIEIGDEIILANIDDNPTSRDFINLLPLTLKLDDFNHAEKISGALPNPLSVSGAPTSYAGEISDIAYYAPWGNLAIFYQPGPNARGLVKMGRIISGTDLLTKHSSLNVKISCEQSCRW